MAVYQFLFNKGVNMEELKNKDLIENNFNDDPDPKPKPKPHEESSGEKAQYNTEISGQRVIETTIKAQKEPEIPDEDD